MKYNLLFCLFLVFSISNAQQSKIEALHSLLKRDKPDTNKINHLNDLGWELSYSNPDTSIILGKQALSISTTILKTAKNKVEKQTAKRIRGNIFGQLGTYYYFKANYLKALDYYL